MTEITPAPVEPVATPHRKRMSTRSRLLFFAVAWAIVLMPFLFWRGTWFGRPLDDKEIQEYLHDQEKPRHIQHAVVQIGERINKGDKSVERWYPDLVALASSPVEEIRNTVAWVMGQDNTRPEFHSSLRGLVRDSSALVRGNAALALVRFGDDAGRPVLAEMLQPSTVTAPVSGIISDLATPGTAVRQNGVLAKIKTGGGETEVRSPIGGRVRSAFVSRDQSVQAGAKVALMDPDANQVWEALRALYLVGTPDELSAVRQYEKASPDMPDRVRQQAVLTEKEILRRAGK